MCASLEEQRYRAMVRADLATLERLLDDGLTLQKVWEYKNISRQNERVVIHGG